MKLLFRHHHHHHYWLNQSVLDFFLFPLLFFLSLPLSLFCLSLYAYTSPFFSSVQYIISVLELCCVWACICLFFCLFSSLPVCYWCWTVLFWIKERNRMLQVRSTKNISWDSGYSSSLVWLFYWTHTHIGTQLWRERKKVSRKDSIHVYISYTTRLFVSIVFSLVLLLCRRCRRLLLRELQWMSERKLNEGKTAVRKRGNLGNMHIEVLYTQLWIEWIEERGRERERKKRE